MLNSSRERENTLSAERAIRQPIRAAAAIEEWRRVLRPSGSIFLNIGDTYWRKSLAGIPSLIEVEARRKQRLTPVSYALEKSAPTIVQCNNKPQRSRRPVRRTHRIRNKPNGLLTDGKSTRRLSQGVEAPNKNAAA